MQKPNHQAKLIGPAAKLETRLVAHVGTIRDKAASPKLLFFGDPGIGKTTLANRIAAALASPFDVESVNGRDLTIDLVRRWMANSSMGSLFGSWKIKIVNEVDLVPLVAQDLMLSYLDELPPQTAIIATTNKGAHSLSERFTTRFTHCEVKSPAPDAIAALLIKQTRIPKAIANMIAVTSCGNVRAAILQAEGYAITGELSEVPKHTAPVICASRSDSAKRAWETMRAKSQETTAEKELRTLWTSQGVPLKRQNELIADIAKKAAPGAYVGPFRIPA